MKKLAKKLDSNKESVIAYECYCYCTNSCTCDCSINYYASISISNGMVNVPNQFRTFAVSGANSNRGY